MFSIYDRWLEQLLKDDHEDHIQIQHVIAEHSALFCLHKSLGACLVAIDHNNLVAVNHTGYWWQHDGVGNSQGPLMHTNGLSRYLNTFHPSGYVPIKLSETTDKLINAVLKAKRGKTLQLTAQCND